VDINQSVLLHTPSQECHSYQLFYLRSSQSPLPHYIPELPAELCHTLWSRHQRI